MLKKILGCIFGIHILTVEGTLEQAQYDRIKKQIDDSWPKYLERPLLVEGGVKVTRI